jgi:hypothetical protein
MQINCQHCFPLSPDAAHNNLLMSAPSSLNVLINQQALSQAGASPCGNVIYMIRGAKTENGNNQIVIQNTQELLNLLNKNHSKFSVAESIVERTDGGAPQEFKLDTKASDNVNNHLNLQHLSKDSRIVIKTLDKSHSFLVVRNGTRHPPVSLLEKDDSRTSPANEQSKESNESPETPKTIPIGSGEFEQTRNFCLSKTIRGSGGVVHAFKFAKRNFTFASRGRGSSSANLISRQTAVTHFYCGSSTSSLCVFNQRNFFFSSQPYIEEEASGEIKT